MKISVGPEAPARRADQHPLPLRRMRGARSAAGRGDGFSGKANALFYCAARARACTWSLGARAKMGGDVSFGGGAATFFLKKDRRATTLRCGSTEWPQFRRPGRRGCLLADYRFERFQARKPAIC